MAYCNLTGVVNGQDGSTLQPGVQLTVFRVLSTTGSVILNQKKIYTLLNSGAWSPLIHIERDSVAYVYLNAPGFDGDSRNGSPLAIPDASSAMLASIPAAVNFPNLVPVAIPADSLGNVLELD